MIKRFLPVRMRRDAETLRLVDGVDDELPRTVRFDEAVRAHMEHVRAVTRDFIAGNEQQVTGIKRGMVIGRGEDVMIGDHEEAVAAPGVVVDDGLRFALTVASGGVCVQVTA